jgi:hypothetical protein
MMFVLRTPGQPDTCFDQSLQYVTIHIDKPLRFPSGQVMATSRFRSTSQLTFSSTRIDQTSPPHPGQLTSTCHFRSAQVDKSTPFAPASCHVDATKHCEPIPGQLQHIYFDYSLHCYSLQLTSLGTSARVSPDTSALDRPGRDCSRHIDSCLFRPCPTDRFRASPVLSDPTRQIDACHLNASRLLAPRPFTSMRFDKSFQFLSRLALTYHFRSTSPVSACRLDTLPDTSSRLLMPTPDTSCQFHFRHITPTNHANSLSSCFPADRSGPVSTASSRPRHISSTTLRRSLHVPAESVPFRLDESVRVRSLRDVADKSDQVLASRLRPDTSSRQDSSLPVLSIPPRLINSDTSPRLLMPSQSRSTRLRMPRRAIRVSPIFRQVESVPGLINSDKSHRC